jgi:short-subunit dehydrogenase
MSQKKVLVITGASSGIGKATALQAAQKGWNLVLIGRRKEALQKTSAECLQLGGQALVLPIDTTDAVALTKAVKKAYDYYGQIDVWVNNASVYSVGSFEAVPDQVIHRVMEVNFFGYVNSARAVLPLFKNQKHGHIINVVSVFGKIPAPLVTSYCASKFAVDAFFTGLRAELEGLHIPVTNIYPSAMDTPIFHHSANYSGKPLKNLDPAYDPAEVASAIVHAVEKPKDEIVVGTYGKVGALAHRWAPGLVNYLIAQQVYRNHFSPGSAPPSNGNLFEPMREWTSVRGGWSKS